MNFRARPWEVKVSRCALTHGGQGHARETVIGLGYRDRERSSNLFRSVVSVTASITRECPHEQRVVCHFLPAPMGTEQITITFPVTVSQSDHGLSRVPLSTVC